MADTEQTFDSLLTEDRTFPPPPEFAARANAADPAIYQRAAADPQACDTFRKRCRGIPAPHDLVAVKLKAGTSRRKGQAPYYMLWRASAEWTAHG